ncbi:3-oxoacyl-(acyl-carrier-protein) synthase III [Synechococcus sp. PCC 7502]|uniref:beta-ketoacyl-ACP synthase III n=1 Tax=Synechococcus sp. PCC 7502 TaxID=1173263 RepID=UPI00029FF57B|nr:beta-ketoacyl-ACP synthase III [Synechococcus sp. PCC 7502]AFY75022.1 3-oxoacyl-(acyl-carrier-protein) synthase III [Synechococcus sp. PCC 7502]
MNGVRIIGSGSALPQRIITNDELSQTIETSDEWIASRTGIRQRRVITSDQESLASLATVAGKQAIAMAGIEAEDLDLIILATSSPDDLFGSAAQVQYLLGAEKAVAFDLSAACSGFVFGLVTASQFIQTGTYRNILLIGADVLSRWVDWSDRRTCILFGDGAGAVVLQASEQKYLLGFELRSDGKGNPLLNLSHGSTGYEHITMNGGEVYRFAVKSVPEVLDKALFRANLTVGDIDWLILHQANQRILDAVQSRMGFAPEKVITNLSNYGNTSAASIPLALDESVRSYKIKTSDTIAISGFGAGLSWGAAVFKWG